MLINLINLVLALLAGFVDPQPSPYSPCAEDEIVLEAQAETHCVHIDTPLGRILDNRPQEA